MISWDYKNFIRRWSRSWRLVVRVLVRPAKHQRFFISAKPWHFVGWFCPSSDRSTSEKLFSGYFGFSSCLYASLPAHKSTVLISQHKFYQKNTNTCYGEWIKKLHCSFCFFLSPRHHSITLANLIPSQQLFRKYPSLSQLSKDLRLIHFPLFVKINTRKFNV